MTAAGAPHRRKVINPLTAGAIALVIVVLGAYFGFTKHIPFTHGFELKAVFSQANSVRLKSPVRIAGVTVGKVVKVERQPGTDAAILTLELNDEGLPIHKDATLKIRPRIFLEGNFFIDVKPGTPSAPTLKSGATIPITQTATPVQLDQILTALQSDSRQGLQEVLAGLGTALSHKPTAPQDATQDPAVRGETAAQALNDAYAYSGEALKNTALINEALLGTEAGDLSKLIAGLGAVSAALNVNDGELQQLIANLNTTLGAFAAESGSLRRSVALLGPTVDHANAALSDLNAAFPATRALALELTPGVKQIPNTIKATDPFIVQARKLVSAQELGGVAADLQQVSPDLSQTIYQGITLFKQVDLVSRCVNDKLLPAGDVQLDDGDLSSGVANYKEFFYALVGLAGEGQNFDGNGQYLRLDAGGGATLVETPKLAGKPQGQNQYFGNSVLKPLGTRPKWPNKTPTFKTDVSCYKSASPDLNGPAADTGPASPAARTP